MSHVTWLIDKYTEIQGFANPDKKASWRPHVTTPPSQAFSDIISTIPYWHFRVEWAAVKRRGQPRTVTVRLSSPFDQSVEIKPSLKLMHFHLWFVLFLLRSLIFASIKILKTDEFDPLTFWSIFCQTDKRRRWGPSTTANVYQMILNQAQARKQNDYISFAYIFYHILMLIFSLIGVSTTLMMVAEAFHITLGYNIGKAWCYAIVVLPVVLYAAGCLMSNDQDLQLSMAKWLSLAFRFVITYDS